MQDKGEFSVTKLFQEARQRLLPHYDFREATQLVSILIEHYAGLTRKDTIIEPQRTISGQVVSELNTAIGRLLKNEPVQYITGIAHFCGNEFLVTPDVLIPRPETEELVRWVLDDFHEQHHLKILDVGTGSACIAISLWLRFQDAEVEAWDISESALKIAALNNASLSSKVIIRMINFLDASAWPDSGYDIVISNPPYISIADKDRLPMNVVGYEPHSALFTPGLDPMIFYHMLAKFGQNFLKPHGAMYCELHEYFAKEVENLFLKASYKSVEIRHDLNNRARMLKVCK